MAEGDVAPIGPETEGVIRNLDAVIVGGGLGGLHAARLLAAAGLNYVLLEARSRLGGRILSVPAETAASQGWFDLGPAWFWPDQQPRMARLIAELGLRAFSQHEVGLTRIERSKNVLPQSITGYRQQPAAFRLHGGMAALSEAAAAPLPPNRLLTGYRVMRVSQREPGVLVEARMGNGGMVAFEAAAVIMAVPPRLAVSAIEFLPAWPSEYAAALLETPTWMAGQAKLVAVYERPFWRANGLSGAGRSLVGPLGEVHDASTTDGLSALFGFVGIPATQRAALGEDLISQAIAQLARMFGTEAASPVATLFKDWAGDDLTATALDLRPGPAHPEPYATQVAIWGPGLLTWAGSEAAAMHGGYLEGALEAAEAAVSSLLAGRCRMPFKGRLAF